MQISKITHPSSPPDRLGLAQRFSATLLKKLWLPRGVYEAIPYLYLLAGVLALLSAIYSETWAWILPYLVLLGLVCLHAGIAILTLRYRFRRRRPGLGQDRRH
jgi:hypothetical protein